MRRAAMVPKEAWDRHFGPVIASFYKNEEDFSNALFEALRKSLSEFLEEPAGDNPKLKAATSEQQPSSQESIQAIATDDSKGKPKAGSYRSPRGHLKSETTHTALTGDDNGNPKAAPCKRGRPKNETIHADLTADDVDNPSSPPHKSKRGQPKRDEPTPAVVTGGKSSKRKAYEMGQNETIRLKHCNVGFATEVCRHRRLGLPSSYATSKDSRVAHACLIFGSQIIEEAGTRRRKPWTETSTRTTAEQHEFIHDDVMACVELKLSNSSCAVYNPEVGLDVGGFHGALGQALMYGMDMRHCLARRGQEVTSLSIVVLAGRTSGYQRLCCMQGTLHVPAVLGAQFMLRVDRCLDFSSENDKTAIAIYLSAMKAGLDRAYDIKVRGNTGPTSLCCAQTDGLQFLASPIPGARPMTKFVIGQGELYRVTDQSLSINDFVSDFDEHFCFAAAERKIEGCLVKVFHQTVHNSLVPVDECWTALSKLTSTIGVHAVLLAAAFHEKVCLVTVMEDLSPSFRSLSQNMFPDRSRLWVAFKALVESVFLPLADQHIVHTDIRCERGNQSAYSVSNVLCRSNDDGDYELRLIDYESLCIFKSTSSIKGKQTGAVSLDHFTTIETRSAHLFLFWQVLWMAFAWHESPGDSTQEECSNVSAWAL
jgi:hypothetical protein